MFFGQGLKFKLELSKVNFKPSSSVSISLVLRSVLMAEFKKSSGFGNHCNPPWASDILPSKIGSVRRACLNLLAYLSIDFSSFYLPNAIGFERRGARGPKKSGPGPARRFFALARPGPGLGPKARILNFFKKFFHLIFF
jgi:hypothetical protein